MVEADYEFEGWATLAWPLADITFCLRQQLPPYRVVDRAKVEAAPCRACGAGPALRSNGRKWSCICEDCSLPGPDMPSAYEAVLAWNKLIKGEERGESDY